MKRLSWTCVSTFFEVNTVTWKLHLYPNNIPKMTEGQLCYKLFSLSYTWKYFRQLKKKMNSVGNIILFLCYKGILKNQWVIWWGRPHLCQQSQIKSLSIQVYTQQKRVFVIAGYLHFPSVHECVFHILLSVHRGSCCGSAGYKPD